MPWETQERQVRIRYPGGEREVSESANFVETVNQLLRESGTSTAWVFVRRSGESAFREISGPADAPANFSGIEEVEIRTYLKAG